MCIKISITVNDKNVDTLKNKNSDPVLLSEYIAAQEFALQADSIGWQIGSILIGGILLAFGFLDKKADLPIVFFGGILLVILILSFWFLFFQGQYQVKLMKLYRVREIEEVFNFKQNLFWDKERNGPNAGSYRTFGPGGALLTKLLFIIMNIFTIFYGAVELSVHNPNYSQFEIIYSITLLSLGFLTFITILIIGLCKEKMFKMYLKTKPGNS